MDWQELIDRACKAMLAEEEKRIVEDAKEKGQISEAVLIMNPKHKGQMGEFLYVSGLKIPIIWHRHVEEDKAYMITDKEIARNVREAYHNMEVEPQKILDKAAQGVRRGTL